LTRQQKLQPFAVKYPPDVLALADELLKLKISVALERQQERFEARVAEFNAVQLPFLVSCDVSQVSFSWLFIG
jgi:hypothetical protein